MSAEELRASVRLLVRHADDTMQAIREGKDTLAERAARMAAQRSLDILALLADREGAPAPLESSGPPCNWCQEPVGSWSSTEGHVFCSEDHLERWRNDRRAPAEDDPE